MFVRYPLKVTMSRLLFIAMVYAISFTTFTGTVTTRLHKLFSVCF
jgi:hypothetical protein